MLSWRREKRREAVSLKSVKKKICETDKWAMY